METKTNKAAADRVHKFGGECYYCGKDAPAGCARIVKYYGKNKRYMVAFPAHVECKADNA